MPDKYTELHLVVPCTASKRKTGAEPLHLSVAAQADYVALARRWFCAVNAQQAQRLPAAQLYCGVTWQRNLAAAACCDQLWVLSAGFGLIRAETPLPVYNLTLSPGSEASLPRLGDDSAAQAARGWWQALETCPENNTSEPGGLVGVLSRHPHCRFLITGSRSYLALVAEALNAAVADAEIQAEQFILSSVWRPPGLVGERTVQYSGHLAAVLGCTMVSLGAVVAHRLLAQNLAFDVTVMQQHLDRMAGMPCERVKVRRLSDEQVVMHIRQIQAAHPEAVHSASQTLQLFRRQYGLSCAQKRFSALYKQLTSD